MAKTVTIEGFREIDRMLKQLPEKIRARTLGQAVLAGLKGAVKIARGKVPVDEQILKKSLGTQLLKRRRSKPYRVASMGPRKSFKRNAPAGVALTKNARRSLYPAFYGNVLEHGWSTPLGEIPARPFMRPALHQHAPHVLRDMQKNIGKKIENEARKLVKR